jgi:outer membrane biosynthesis protein TonB
MLLVMLAGSVMAQGQSLKDALFSGKLKTEPGTVIRKGDDLSAKMDTTRKVAATESAKFFAPMQDSSSTRAAADKSTAATNVKTNQQASQTETATGTTTVTDAGTAPAIEAPKNNNVIWKQFIDAAVAGLKTEALPSKKLKKGTYYVTVSYVIAPDGQVTISDVAVSPESAYLQQQVKDRLNVDTPKLNPVLSDSGAPRKVTKRYNFTITKD